MKSALNTNKTGAAFTLVEFIIYFAITTVILSFLILSFINLMDSREKIRSHVEVGNAGRYIMENITRSVINSFEILNPEFGGNNDELILRISEFIDEDPAAYDQVRIYLEDSVLYNEIINIGDEPKTIKLNSVLIDVKSLNFQRINNSQIKVSILIGYAGYESYSRQTEEIFETIVNLRVSLDD